jgi:hypothetical protein
MTIRITFDQVTQMQADLPDGTVDITREIVLTDELRTLLEDYAEEADSGSIEITGARQLPS